ncbi:MAG: selenocysteine-specific translation elongation factor [Pyrinomonadaceae bacterium]
MDIIIGTAGHIDHGKTTLVQALTGVDADRLPEEKRRGITIDLGFADRTIDGQHFGFVDVPGHERFVKNMLAGAQGIDVVALVVAADEGVMPQTREHFDICRLLGVQAGIVILTKSDTVDGEMLELVRDEARELVADSFLADAPMLAVSAKTGAGLPELKAALVAIARALPPRTNDTVPHLPIDRAFTMKGFGTVVTGTLVSGELSNGDELELMPAGERVRVRGIQVHGKAVEKAWAGQRTAINLGGIEITKTERGMVLAQPNRLRPTQIIDAHVTVLASAPRPLRSRARIRLHLGAGEIFGRARVLDPSNEVAPGSSGLLQLSLESPIVTVTGERFILRSYSPSHTIAGGLVLDPLAVKHRGRDRGAARDFLSNLLTASPEQRLRIFVERAGSGGLTRADLAARTGWTGALLDRATKAVLETGLVVLANGSYLGAAAFDELAQAAVNAVTDHHQREPLSRGLSRETLREKLFSHVPPEIFRAILARLTAEGSLAFDQQLVRSATHSVTLSESDVAQRDQIAAVYRDAGLEPPTFDEALSRLAKPVNREHARKLLQMLLDADEIKPVFGDTFCDRKALDHLLVKLAAYGSEHEPDRLIDVTAFKELTGVSRKYAIPLLEYLDRTRVTRRAGDKRIILRAMSPTS